MPLLLLLSNSQIPLPPPPAPLPIPPNTLPVIEGQSKYSIEIRDQYGRLVTVIQRPMDRQFSVYRNKAGSCQFTLDVYDPQATLDYLKINQYDVVFRRQGTPVFAGQISYTEPKVDGDSKKVGINAVGYYDLLDQRVINADFPSFDANKKQLVLTSLDCAAAISTLLSDTQFPLSSDGTTQLTGPAQTICQSFIAPGTASVTTLMLLLTNSSASGNLIVGIYPDQNGAPGPTPVPNSLTTIATGTIGSSIGWYTIAFGFPPGLTSGARYWIQASLDTTQSGGNGIYWSYLNNDYYPNGRALCPQSPGFFTATQDLQFFLLMDDNSYQQTKNTYMGLTMGVQETSFNITRTLPQFKSVKQTIDEISKNANGIDFGISITLDANNRMTRQFNVYYPRQGVNNTQLIFSYPGNIIKLGKATNGKTMINVLFARGQGTGSSQAQTTSLGAASVQTYGLREEINDYPDVPDTATLQLLGDEDIRVRKDPLDVPQLTLEGNLPPQLGSYGLGDIILVDITELGIFNLSDTYRIEAIDVTVDQDDKEEIVLGVSKA